MARILLAEDDLSMVAFLAQALERAGHTVTARTDGLKAMQAIEAGDDYDLLLADIVMPGMDGIELAQKARKLRPALRVMFITGFSAVAMGENLQKQDTGHEKTRVLSKPFHLNDLVSQVEAALAG